MQQLIVRHFLATGLLLALLPTVLWGQDIATIRVAAFNYYPAIFLDSDNQVRGFYVDMLDEIAAQQQIRFEYVFGSWNDGLERLRAGEVDLVTSAAFTEERATYMDFGQQVLLTVWGELYIPQSSANVSIRDLQDQPIAVMRADHNARSFKEHLEKFGISSHFIEFADFDEVFTAIRDQQVSAGVVNSVFGDAAAPKYQVQSSGIAFNPFNIYFATAKGQNTELLSLLDDYLLAWRNDSASVYYQARLEWGAGQKPKEVIPGWAINLLAVAALLLLSSLVFIALLRHRVNRATRESQESNTMIRLLLDSTAEGIYGIDLQGICTFCNAACVRILGYENADQIIGHNMHDLIHHSYADGKAIPASQCALLKGFDEQIHSDNEVFWRFDGSCFPVEYWSYPIRQNSKNLGAVISFVDITERKQTEQALIAQKNVYQSILSASHDGFLAVDQQGQIRDVNPAYLAFSGYKRDELLSLHVSELDAQENFEEASRHIKKVMAQGSDLFESEQLRKDGTIWFAEVSTTYNQENNGRFFSFIRDITERKRAEEERHSLLSRLQLLAEHLPGFLYQYQLMPDGTSAFPYASPGIQAIYGLSPEDAARDATPVFAVLHPDDLAQVSASIQHSANTLTLWHDTYRVLHPDGRLLWAEGRATPVRQPDGSILWHGYIHDISERKQAETRLSESESKHRQLVENTHDIIYSLTPEGMFTYVSPAWTILLGHPVTDVEGQFFTEFIHPDDQPACFTFLQKVLTGQRLDGVEYRVQHISGEWRWHTSSATPAKNAEGSVTGYEGIGRDITTRKQAQFALEQKNQELEQFVYSVSHDLKSPLVTVKTYAGMLQQDLLDADRQQVHEDLDYINQAADKMQQLLDALLQYSRIGRVDAPAQTLSARQLVDDCLSSLAGILQHHQVEVTTNALTQQLHGDPLHFGQIWQNLIENAVKYRDDQDQPQIEIGAMPQAEDVVFYVRDNGMGIAAEHSERIFNLFSQLHSGSDGSGLGLALVKKIVTIYQGRIWVESAGEGQGSCFMFTLPGAVVNQDKAR